MKIQPGKVMAKLTPEESKSAGGILIPDTARSVSTEATIIAVGDGVNEVTPGNRVILQPYAGHEVEIDGDQYLVLDARYLLATVG